MQDGGKVVRDSRRDGKLPAVPSSAKRRASDLRAPNIPGQGAPGGDNFTHHLIDVNTNELEELIATLTGIKDGKEWQFANSEFIDAAPTSNPLLCLRNGWRIRLKPWTLGREVNGHKLREGQEWRWTEFWTEDHLPHGTRPLLTDEVEMPEDQYYYGHWKSIGNVNYKDPVSCYRFPRRTTRPIPFLTPAQVAEGWIEWRGGECPVDKSTVVNFIIRDNTKRTRHDELASDLRWYHDNSSGDIIAYRVVKLDQYAECKAAFARGEVVQYLDEGGSEEWITCKSPSFHSSLLWRVKPAPVMVPLGPEDVPPGTVMRGGAETEYHGWCLITSCSITGVRIWRHYSHDGHEITWQQLMELGSQILRPGGEWTRCEKEEAQS